MVVTFWQELDIIDAEPELIFIKEEMFDDHPLGQQMQLTDNRKGKHFQSKAGCMLTYFVHFKMSESHHKTKERKKTACVF